MNTRPVLSMAFYRTQQKSGQFKDILNPYQEMKKMAQIEKQTVKIKQQKAIKKVEGVVNKMSKVMDSFDKEIKTQENDQNTEINYMPKYSPQYFQELNNNLKEINRLLDGLHEEE